MQDRSQPIIQIRINKVQKSNIFPSRTENVTN